MMYKEVYGDLITLAKDRTFNVIVHGCNCFSKQASGIAAQMVKNFNTDLFPLEEPDQNRDPVQKLGNIDFKYFKEYELTVINAYTQYRYGLNHKGGTKNPLDYEALSLCLRKINILFKGYKIGLPKIGSGLAGGDWEVIKNIIKKELVDCFVSVIIYKK